MTLKEFAAWCQSDDRLTSSWDRLVSAAREVICDEIALVFHGVIRPSSRANREEFESARMAILIYSHVQAPDLSIRQFIELLLQYN